MTDLYLKHHLTRMHTLLSPHLNQRLDRAMHAVKIKNCNITKRRAGAFQAPLSPHKLSLPPQLVFLRKVTDLYLKHHLTRMHTLLSSHLNRRLGPAMHAVKIKNCNITKRRAGVFQAPLSPHKLLLPPQLVFLHKVTFIILKSMSLFGVVQQFLFFCVF